MKRTTSIIITIILLVIGWLTTVPIVLGQEPSEAQPAINEREIIPGEIIVRFEDGSQARRSLRSAGFGSAEMLRDENLFRVSVEPGDEAATIASFEQRGDVKYATYNYPVEALLTPDDADLVNQWNMYQATDNDIDAFGAWGITTGTNEILIAVIDSGLDLDHPEFTGRVVTGTNYINPGEPPTDVFEHGTHVAGIAAAQGNNGIGVAGLSWNAKIMPIKMLDSFGSGDSANIALGVYDAIEAGAQVINVSVGQRGSSWPCNMPDVEEAFQTAVRQGILVAVASGNDGQNGVNCPAAYPEAIAVGSTTASDLKASTSNYGDRLDLTAPGQTIYSTVPNDSYDYKNGTSMAAPHVSGLAALLWSFEPTLTLTEVRTIIEESVEDLGAIGRDDLYGTGRLNALWALEKLISVTTEKQSYTFDVIAQQTFPMTVTIPIETNHPNLTDWTATADSDGTWLNLTEEVSAAGEPVLQLTVAPSAQGMYESVVTIQAGETIVPHAITVRLNYGESKVYLPLLFR